MELKELWPDDNKQYKIEQIVKEKWWSTMDSAKIKKDRDHRNQHYTQQNINQKI